MSERLTFTPESFEARKGFRFRAVGTLRRLIEGLVPGELSTLQRVASPAGTIEDCTLEIQGKIAA